MIIRFRPDERTEKELEDLVRSRGANRIGVIRDAIHALWHADREAALAAETTRQRDDTADREEAAAIQADIESLCAW